MRNAKFWSINVVVGTAVLICPLSAPVLQSLNYRAAGENQESLKNAIWAIGIFLILISWNLFPLDLSPIARAASGPLLGLLLVMIWFFAYGRNFPKKIREDVRQAATHRNAWSGIAIAIIVLALSYGAAEMILRVLRVQIA